MTDKVLFFPVQTLSDLNALSDAAIVCGYRDAIKGKPMSVTANRDYWHGYRNGKTDVSGLDPDPAQKRLAVAYIGGGSSN